MLDCERIARVVTHPNHIRKSDGAIKPGVLPITHFSTGLSLLRVDHLLRQPMLKIAEAIAGKKEGERLHGFLVGEAKLLRSITDDDGEKRRSLCVLDDPVLGDQDMPDNPAHALAYRSADQDPGEIERIRAELLDLLTFADAETLHADSGRN